MLLRSAETTRVLEWSVDGKLSTFMSNSGLSNGMYFDRSGDLYACPHIVRSGVSIQKPQQSSFRNGVDRVSGTGSAIVVDARGLNPHQGLRAGRPCLAAIDVYVNERIENPSDPLLRLENVLCTPNIGYVTRDEFEIHFTEMLDQITAYSPGRPVNHLL